MAIIIGAENAGDYGIKVANKKATLVQNMGGQGSGYISETTIEERGRSNKDALAAMAARQGWSVATLLSAYETHF